MKKWYFILASIILFNPLVSIFDIFPDFIAYLLLLKAFSKMSYIDAKADDACRYIRFMLLITVIKPATFFLIPALDTAMYLVYSFVFAALEIIFGFFMFIKIFEALSTYSLQVENVACANNNKIKNLTIAAHIVKLILAMLPDLTELSLYNGADTQNYVPLTHFKTALFFVAVVIALVFETIWLVFINIYNKRLFTKQLADTLNKEYILNTSERPSLVMSKDSMMFCVLACISSAFILDFNLDLVNVLFDSFFSILMLALFTYMLIKKHFKSILWYIVLAIASIGHLVVDIFLTKRANEFFDRFTLVALERYLYNSRELYLPISILSVFSAVLTFGIVFLVLYLVKKQSRRALVEYSSLLVEGSDTELIREFDKNAKKYTIIALITAGVASINYVLYITLRYAATALTALNTISELVFVCFFIRAMLYYYDNVYKRIYVHS